MNHFINNMEKLYKFALVLIIIIPLLIYIYQVIALKVDASIPSSDIAFIVLYIWNSTFITAFIFGYNMYLGGYIAEPTEKNRNLRKVIAIIGFIFMLISAYQLLRN